jgi:hypothetical protein
VQYISMSSFYSLAHKGDEMGSQRIKVMQYINSVIKTWNLGLNFWRERTFSFSSLQRPYQN